MAIFANVEIEEKVQLDDRTRLDAQKSFVTAGAITDVTIRPGADETPLSVFNTDQTQWFLDWEFQSWKADIDATNNKIDFTENAGDLVATLTSGTYTLSALITEVQTRLNAVGSNTYTLAVDSDDRLTVSATGNFSLLPKTGANKTVSPLNMLGFFKDTQSSSSVRGRRIEYLVRKITATATVSPTSDTRDKYIKVYSVLGDHLFASDDDLRTHEADILRWVPPGRNTFLDLHRRVQTKILQYLDRQGFVDIFDEKFTKASVVDIDEVREWATAMALRLIFEGISNAVDDKFADKAKVYREMENDARNRAVLRLDIDQDGDIDREGEQIRIATGEIYRL